MNVALLLTESCASQEKQRTVQEQFKACAVYGVHCDLGVGKDWQGSCRTIFGENISHPSHQ